MELVPYDLNTILRQIGRASIWYAVDDAGEPEVWDYTSELNLAFLGDTEGDVTHTRNGSVAVLTLPEISGGAPHEATDLGEAPVLEMPLFLADPDLWPIVSPRGSAHAGHIRTCDVAQRTIVVFPERVFRVVSADGSCQYKTLEYTTAGGWKVNGVAVTAAQETDIEMILWLWAGWFDKPDTGFMGGHGDDGKEIRTVNFNSIYHPSLPDGHRLYTRGDPATYGIDIEGNS